MNEKYCPFIDDFCVGTCMFRAVSSCHIVEAAAALESIADSLDIMSDCAAENNAANADD